MLDKMKSRKLIVLVGTVLLTVLNEKLGLGLDEDTMNKIIAAAAAYIVGQGIADHGSQGKKPDVVVAKGEEEGPNWGDTSEVDEGDKKEILG